MTGGAITKAWRNLLSALGVTKEEKEMKEVKELWIAMKEVSRCLEDTVSALRRYKFWTSDFLDDEPAAVLDRNWTSPPQRMANYSDFFKIYIDLVNCSTDTDIDLDSHIFIGGLTKALKMLHKNINALKEDNLVRKSKRYQFYVDEEDKEVVRGHLKEVEKSLALLQNTKWLNSRQKLMAQ